MTGFPSVKMILRVESEVKKVGVVTGLETHHFVASLEADEASPKRLMRVVRGHWGVENSLHFIKDRWWDEDCQWSIRSGLATLRPTPGLPEDLSICGRADHLGRKVRQALKFMGALS